MPEEKNGSAVVSGMPIIATSQDGRICEPRQIIPHVGQLFADVNRACRRASPSLSGSGSFEGGGASPGTRPGPGGGSITGGGGSIGSFGTDMEFLLTTHKKSRCDQFVQGGPDV